MHGETMKRKIVLVRFIEVKHFWSIKAISAAISGSCHHGLGCPQVADGGMASSTEGSCEYIE